MNMRIVRFILAVAVTGVFACGCPSAPEPPAPGPEPSAPVRPESFSAAVETIEGIPQPVWGEGTGVTVYFQPSSDGRTFLVGGNPSSIGEEGFSDYYKALAAVYPASFESSFTAEGLAVELPQVQEYDSNGISPGAMPLAALGDTTGKLDFKYLCGLLEVDVSHSLNIREIRLTSLKDEALWGTLAVSAEPSQFPSASMRENASEGRNTLILRVSGNDAGNQGNEVFVSGPNSTVSSGTIPAAGTETSGRYFFAVPAGTLQQGYRLTILDERGGYMQKVFPAVTAGRASCVKAGDLAYRDASDDIEVRTDVLNKAFYKDIYMNSGLFLTTNDTLPVADFLNLSIEHMMDARNSPTPADYAAQDAAFIGSEEDSNGRLLYPDGGPRYRLFYVRGGGSSSHGLSLGSDGRDRFRAFVAAGGSYMGSCAGAYLATRGTSLDGNTAGNYTGLWPGHCNALTTKQIYPGHVIPPDSPILKYYDFGGDFYIDSVRHHNGPCFIDYDCVPGTEVITRFDIPDSTKMHGHPAIITWKKDKWSGRVTPCGSHPEQVPSGENLLLMAAMVRYGFDGVGIARVKGVLRNGEIRRMVKSTEDHDPDYTKIGDRQCHHFVFSLPEGARNVKVRVESLGNYNLSLRMAKGTFAFKEDAEYAVEGVQSGKQLFFPSLEAGTWYVGVQCESVPTVTDNHGTYGTEYSNTGILNGAPYTVQVSWDYE